MFFRGAHFHEKWRKLLLSSFSLPLENRQQKNIITEEVSWKSMVMQHSVTIVDANSLYSFYSYKHLFSGRRMYIPVYSISISSWIIIFLIKKSIFLALVKQDGDFFICLVPLVVKTKPFHSQPENFFFVCFCWIQDCYKYLSFGHYVKYFESNMPKWLLE